MEFLLAFQFLTRIPVTIRGTVEEKSVARSMAYFPLIGLFIGLSTAVLHGIISNATAVSVGDLTAVAFMVVITGNMHLDGLMDTADGIFSGRPREEMLKIMKDSRVGAHGVATGVLALLAKFVLLGQISPGIAKGVALVIAPVLGRWIQVYGAAVYPYARTSGGNNGFTELVGRREVSWASLTVLAAAFFSFGLQFGLTTGIVKGFFTVIVVLAGAVLMGRYITGKLAGITGDTLGAMSECVELLTLFIIVVSSRIYPA